MRHNKGRFVPGVSSLESRTLLAQTNITFDDLPAQTLIADQYASRGAAFNFTGQVQGSVNQAFGGFMPSRSGTHVATTLTLPGQTPLMVIHAVNRAWRMVGGFVTGTKSVTMTAYSANDIPLGSISTGAGNSPSTYYAPFLGTPGQPNQLLQIRGSTAIDYVTISSNAQFTLDDFHFDTQQPSSNFSVNSIIRNNSPTPQLSNGDVEVNYSTFGNNIPGNPTYAVYWASGTTVNDIIHLPGLGPVASGLLDKTPGALHAIRIKMTTLVSAPAAATHLVAVLDNQYSVNETTEADNVKAYTNFKDALSFELESIAPRAATRERRVWLWLKQNAQLINDWATVYHIAPAAVAGAIAWEGLQNPLLFSYRGSGVGKLHAYDWPWKPLVPSVFIEGNTLYTPVLKTNYIWGHNGGMDPDSIKERIFFLTNTETAIKYIAAIMNAYATEVEVANKAESNPEHLFPEIRKNPAILTTLYNGVEKFNLSTAPADLARKKLAGDFKFDVNKTMGLWLIQNLDYLESAL